MRCSLDPIKQRMADNGWMYTGRVDKIKRTEEWEMKTNILVKELGRGSKAKGVRGRCPCTHCKNRDRQGKEDMTKHLWLYGYTPNYVTHVDFDQYERLRVGVMRQRIDGNEYDGLRNMLDDHHAAYMPDSPPPQEEQEEPGEPEAPDEPEEPEPTAKAFYETMASATKPLYEGANVSQLDAVAQLLSDKCQFSTTRAGFEANLTTSGNMLPKGHCLPKSMHETKKLLGSLSMDYEKIHCCPKGCLLFRKQYANDKYCSLCGASRYEEKTLPDGRKKQGKIPVKVLRYLSFIKRMQRLFMSEESAKQMTWHRKGKRYVDELGREKMGHPSDGEAWKNFDLKHPLNSADARNVRIAIATDGFNPFGMSTASYSCWPVFVIPLNLPPGVLMQRKHMFLSLIIPGPEYPGKNLSVYMQPLVDDLHHSWHNGT